MNKLTRINLVEDAFRVAYTSEIASFCEPFSCDDPDLDDFFNNVALYYDEEMLGKTYAWLSDKYPHQILGMVTLANDSVKLKLLAKSALNRLQRNVTNAKRGINYPAVLIGRLGVSSIYHGLGYGIGTQIIDFIKDWFRSSENKTGCRFIVVDAYNNHRTLHFYEKNGFKYLYKTEAEERDFLGIPYEKDLETRFMFFDLKSI